MPGMSLAIGSSPTSRFCSMKQITSTHNRVAGTGFLPPIHHQKVIFGSSGNTLVGGETSDYLYGGEGGDTLIGNAGDDYLEGSTEATATYTTPGTVFDYLRYRWFGQDRPRRCRLGGVTKIGDGLYIDTVIILIVSATANGTDTLLINTTY